MCLLRELNTLEQHLHSSSRWRKTDRQKSFELLASHETNQSILLKMPIFPQARLKRRTSHETN